MLPVASFFALRTHSEPTLFAPSGATSGLQAPAAFKVATPWHSASEVSLICALPLLGVRDSSAYASTDSTASAYSRPFRSLSSSGVLPQMCRSVLAQQGPASSASSANEQE